MEKAVKGWSPGDSYKRYLCTKHWQKLSKSTTKSYPFCAACASDEDLVVHHTTYDNLGNENKADLMVMCKCCHEILHDYLDQKYLFAGLEYKVRQTYKLFREIFGRRPIKWDPNKKSKKKRPRSKFRKFKKKKPKVSKNPPEDKIIQIQNQLKKIQYVHIDKDYQWTPQKQLQVAKQGISS